jgi:hypothetical protein
VRIAQVIYLNARITDIKYDQNEIVNTVPPEIEDTILLSFGHAIVEFEETLYKKFQHLTRGIVLNKREFIEHLENMEQRGIVVSGIFLGKKCWAMGPDGSNIWD